MVWRKGDPQGDEAQKVRYDLVPYLGATCLDIGCGPSKVFPHFIGLDSCKDTQLFVIPMKPDIAGDCSGKSRIIFGNESFDTVFSSHTLEHIDDHVTALREWWRLVKVGGYLILYLPHRDLYPRIGQPDANPDHKHDFDEQQIIDAMHQAASDDAPWELVISEKRDQLREYSFLQVYRKREAGAGCIISHPVKRKSAAVVRLGALGDALWASSILPHLKAEGYHVTVYTGDAGAEVLAFDPHIDRLITVSDGLFDDNDLILFFIWEAHKYQRFINLTGVVETRLLMHPNELPYYWPQEVRHREMNRNYFEALHDLAQVPQEYKQKFYPTSAERDWAKAERATMQGPVVVVAPTGSGLPKTWPHVQRFMQMMAERGIYTIILGEIRQQLKPPARFGQVVGTQLPIRLAMALACEADIVVGTESSIINAVAMESNFKIVLLSHSSAENLTKHWPNTYAIEVTGLPCHPCHRLHRAFEFCVRDKQTGFAACQAAVSADAVSEVVAEYLARANAQKAA